MSNIIDLETIPRAKGNRVRTRGIATRLLRNTIHDAPLGIDSSSLLYRVVSEMRRTGIVPDLTDEETDQFHREIDAEMTRLTNLLIDMERSKHERI